MAPATTKQWVVNDKENGFNSLSFNEKPVPQVTGNEVLVKFHAASLNFRDLIIPQVSPRAVTRAIPRNMCFEIATIAEHNLLLIIRANIHFPLNSPLYPARMVLVK